MGDLMRCRVGLWWHPCLFFGQVQRNPAQLMLVGSGCYCAQRVHFTSQQVFFVEHHLTKHNQMTQLSVAVVLRHEPGQPRFHHHCGVRCRPWWRPHGGHIAERVRVVGERSVSSQVKGFATWMIAATMNVCGVVSLAVQDAIWALGLTDFCESTLPCRRYPLIAQGSSSTRKPAIQSRARDPR